MTWVWTPCRHDEKRGAVTTENGPTIAAHAGATTREIPTVAAHAGATTRRDQRSPRTPARRPGGRPTAAAHAGATTRGDQRSPRTPARQPGETNGRRAHRRDDQERPTVAAHTGAMTRGAVRIHDPCLTFSSRKGCPTAMHAGMMARTTAGADLPPLPTTGAPHCI